jgi:hypothetical protein
MSPKVTNGSGLREVISLGASGKSSTESFWLVEGVGDGATGRGSTGLRFPNAGAACMRTLQILKRS